LRISADSKRNTSVLGHLTGESFVGLRTRRF
jgi:hypothetical protein